MNPHRPRRPRSSGAARILAEWRDHVESTERRVRNGDYGYYIDCPCCNGVVLTDARDRLESVLRKGGRRARRLRPLVHELDDRFRDVTAVYPHAWRSEPWWHRRLPHI